MVCTVQGEHDADLELYRDYAGARFYFCCNECVVKYDKEPAKWVKTSRERKGVTTAEFLFDPVSGAKVRKERARGTSDFQGIRFFFTSAANKQAFDKEPARFGKLPEKESLTCPVMNEPVRSYAQADSFVDFEGVRYWMCCASCFDPMRRDPQRFASKVTPTAPRVFKPAK